MRGVEFRRGSASALIGQGKTASHPRAMRLVGKSQRGEEDMEALSRKAGAVIPKGRNFQ